MRYYYDLDNSYFDLNNGLETRIRGCEEECGRVERAVTPRSIQFDSLLIN